MRGWILRYTDNGKEIAKRKPIEYHHRWSGADEGHEVVEIILPRKKKERINTSIWLSVKELQRSFARHSRYRRTVV